MKHVQLWRRFGTWPIKGFEALSTDEREKFWREAGQCRTLEDLDGLIVDKLTSVRINMESTNFDGEWLPLSVWVNRGWNGDEIKATAVDGKTSKPHARFGTVCKVVIDSEHMHSIRQAVREQVLQAKQAARAKQLGEKNEEAAKHKEG